MLFDIRLAGAQHGTRMHRLQSVLHSQIKVFAMQTRKYMFDCIGMRLEMMVAEVQVLLTVHGPY